MMDVTQQLSAINSAGFDAAARFVSASFDDAERLFRLQHDATRRLFSDNIEAFRAIVEPAGNGDGLAELPKRYAENLGRMAEVARECVALVSQRQAELVRMMGEQAATINRTVAQTVLAPAGAESAAGGGANPTG